MFDVQALSFSTIKYLDSELSNLSESVHGFNRDDLRVVSLTRLQDMLIQYLSCVTALFEITGLDSYSKAYRQHRAVLPLCRTALPTLSTFVPFRQLLSDPVLLMIGLDHILSGTPIFDARSQRHMLETVLARLSRGRLPQV